MTLTYLIPSAKEMTTDNATIEPSPLSAKSKAVLQAMTSLALDDLANCYHLSLAAAEKEAIRWAAIQTRAAKTYPALHLFNGLMYRHIDRALVTPETPVYITSSFYGIIQALAPIAEHRHDFHTKITINNKSLTSFWRPDYDAFAKEQQMIISLLSSEFSSVFSPHIRERFISVTFMENHDGQLKSHSTISKKARGDFLSQALLEKAKNIADLKQLSFAGFRFRTDLSSEKELVFVKSVK